MKQVLHTFLLLTLILYSCESNYDDVIEETLPTAIEQDFTHRYPEASIKDFVNYSDNNTTKITFEGNDGLKCIAIYLNGIWMITQKEYNPENFLTAIPRKVIRTYLQTGVEDEEFLTNSDYIVEISRNGFEQKQYEFHFHTPENNGKVHLVNEIAISEDGTLLLYEHTGMYNRSISWYDIRDAYRCVKEKYPSSTILGAINYGGTEIIYLNDNGILKKAITKLLGYRYEWVGTQYQLDLNTSLPESVQKVKEEQEAKNPHMPFFKLSFYEDYKDKFYQLTFGSEMNNITISVKAE